MADDLLPLGLYRCTSHERSSSKQVIVCFRVSASDYGGNALFRLPNEQAAQFEDGKWYKLFAGPAEQTPSDADGRKRK